MDRSPAELEANRPSQPIAAPNRSRHALDAISRRSRNRERNSIALPDVDMAHDTEMIRQGYGDSLGNHRWRINDRVYVQEGTRKGTLFPESGPGIINLNRFEFRALRILVRYNGYTEEAARELEQNPKITRETIDKARELFDLRTTKKP